MYDIKRRTQFNTVGDLKKLLEGVPDETKVCVTGDDYCWFHIEEDESVICLDCEELCDAYEIECPLGGDTTEDCKDCAYSCDYHYVGGECVEREEDVEPYTLTPPCKVGDTLYVVGCTTQQIIEVTVDYIVYDGGNWVLVTSNYTSIDCSQQLGISVFKTRVEAEVKVAELSKDIKRCCYTCLHRHTDICEECERNAQWQWRGVAQNG